MSSGKQQRQSTGRDFNLIGPLNLTYTQEVYIFTSSDLYPIARFLPIIMVAESENANSIALTNTNQRATYYQSRL